MKENNDDNINRLAEEEYPGVAVDEGDNDKVNPSLVDEETKLINNNRNDHPLFNEPEL